MSICDLSVDSRDKKRKKISCEELPKNKLKLERLRLERESVTSVANDGKRIKQGVHVLFLEQDSLIPHFIKKNDNLGKLSTTIQKLCYCGKLALS